MIKNFSLPALLLLVSLSLHIVSCENISPTEDITSKARLYFEENATNLVLPDLSGNPLSKSEQLDEIFNNVYISWDKAKTVSTDSSIVTEAPIVSLEKTLVTLNESHGEPKKTDTSFWHNIFTIITITLWPLFRLSTPKSIS